MAPAGSGDEAAGPRAPRKRGGGGRAAAAAGSGSKKRKAAVRITESDDLTNEEDLNMQSDDSLRISKEIENLTSQLAKKKKELRYSQEVKKLKVELSLKAKDVECLMKQNEELKSKNEGFRNNVVELESHVQAKNRHLLQLERQIKILELSNARLEEDNRKLQGGNNTETCCVMNPQSCSPSQNASQEDISLSSELQSQSEKTGSMSKSPDESSSEKCAEKKVDDGRMVAYHLLDPYYEKQHRATKIAAGEVLQALRLRTQVNSIMPYDERYTPLLRRANLAGFANVVRRGMPPFNRAALTALVDRWRPETHSFHLPCGEMTVTLQDVTMILALPVRGEPVTGRVVYKGWQQRAEEFLGRPLDGHSKKLNGVLLSWLRSNFSCCPVDADEDTVTFYARAWVLHMFGSVLFPDGGGNTASWMYIPCLLDWDQAGTYSWGSAVLGFLYRQLCEACCRTAPSSNLSGCLFLLQVWMWERLPVGRPFLREQRTWYPDRGQDLGPTVSHLWESVARPHGRSQTMYLSYTNELDILSSGQVEWQPYTKPDVQNLVLNSMCRRDEDLWTMRCPLICFYVVEFHLPHRVMRQFNKIQSCPPEPFSTSIQLHKCDRRRQKKIDDFMHHHRGYIDEWRRYERNVVQVHNMHRDKEFRQYLDWLHTAARVHLRPAWTEGDYADIQSSGDEDNLFDTTPRAGMQVEIAPILDRVGRGIKRLVDEAGMVLEIAPGEPNEASRLRQCVERIQVHLRRLAERVGCRMNAVSNVISPVHDTASSPHANERDEPSSSTH